MGSIANFVEEEFLPWSAGGVDKSGKARVARRVSRRRKRLRIFYGLFLDKKRQGCLFWGVGEGGSPVK